MAVATSTPPSTPHRDRVAADVNIIPMIRSSVVILTCQGKIPC